MKLALFVFALALLAACASPTSSPKAKPFTNPEHALILNEVVSSGGYYGNVSIAIEIYNPNTTPTSLSEYTLRTPSIRFDVNSGDLTYSGSKTFALPDVTIPAGGYAAVRSRVSNSSESGGLTIFLNDSSSSASTLYSYPWAKNSAGFVELLNPMGSVDFVRWGSSNELPGNGSYSGQAPALTDENSDTGPAGTYTGYSWSRSASSTDTRSGDDWTLHAWSTLGGKNDITNDTDADVDGIPDQAEVEGARFAGLDLYSWGARTNQKDIFIHVDYQVNGSVGATDPGIIPQKAAFDKFVATFEAKGIKVHLDVGDLFGSGVSDYNLDGESHAVAYNTGSVSLGIAAGKSNAYKYKSDSMPIAKGKVFFYMLFADSQIYPPKAGSSGIANLPGNTSIITLGHGGLVSNGSPEQMNKLVNFQAATMLHEFGHNLGLHHGGDVDDNYKPNYLSVMNYLYQLDGIPADPADYDTRYYAQWDYMNRIEGFNPPLASTWSTRAEPGTWADSSTTTSFVLDYSSGEGEPIDEANANETKGIGRVGATIDFNNDGDSIDTSTVYSFTDESGIQQRGIRYMLDPDLTNTSLTTLKDFNDWNAINSIFQRGYAGTANGLGPHPLSFSTVRDLLEAHEDTTSNPCFDPFAARPRR